MPVFRVFLCRIAQKGADLEKNIINHCVILTTIRKYTYMTIQRKNRKNAKLHKKKE